MEMSHFEVIAKQQQRREVQWRFKLKFKRFLRRFFREIWQFFFREICDLKAGDSPQKVSRSEDNTKSCWNQAEFTMARAQKVRLRIVVKWVLLSNNDFSGFLITLLCKTL
jgi:hypothetical protein